MNHISFKNRKYCCPFKIVQKINSCPDLLFNVIKTLIVCLAITLLLTHQDLFASSPLQQMGNTGVPKMVFDSLTYNAGIVKPGDNIQGKFIIKNKGNGELVIKSVSPT